MTEDQPYDEFVEREDREVGVGPHPLPWPADAQFDPELLEHGDRRNVADEYRYWSHEAIVADLDTRRHSFHVAIENWQHDLNIGTVVRTANAFNAEGVHIVGKKRWNRRGAMVTDKYMHVHHHENIDALISWSVENDLQVVGIDIMPGPFRSKPHLCPSAPCSSLVRKDRDSAKKPAPRRQWSAQLPSSVQLVRSTLASLRV